MRHATLALVPTALLSACAAIGPRYEEQMAAAPPLAEQHARIVVFRQSSTPQYAIREARLQLDRAAVGGVMPSGFRVFDLPAGAHTVVADMWDAPGRCELTLRVEAGTTAYVEVAPRLAAWLAGAPSMTAPPTPMGSFIGLALMLTGMAAESSGKECGGAFALSVVDEAAVLPTLAQLRSSQ
ncbi:MAG TPA: hypothetical protein VFK10_12210 [Burkholderiaceae bacterium]|nr:hypothetical protein [Burkholderiaceae bacterium]